MKENFIKKLIKLHYCEGSLHYILFGPMKGLVFRVNRVTQLMPIYSGTERWHQRCFRDMLHKGDVVIDIGASWGLHTLYTSKLVGNTGMVISIEPFLYAFMELKWHVKKNKCSNVITLDAAVGAYDGKVDISYEDGAGQGIVYDCCKNSHIVKNNISVRQKKLDTITEEIDMQKIDLIKIDVEGAEHNVLMGAEQTVEKYRPYIIIDPHNPDNDLFVGRWLAERHYEIQRINKKLPRIKRIDRSWPDPEGVWGTLLAMPRNKYY